MSSSNAHEERFHEELDPAIQENAPTGKLDDAEIQRLVRLSNDANYQRSDRVPVKTAEAFEARSLVSIAMAAQRRREQLATTVDAADQDLVDADEAIASSMAKASEDAVSGDQIATETTNELNKSTDVHIEMPDDSQASLDDTAKDMPVSTSQVDFEAGRAEGFEEGRQIGFEEGQAKGMEEGRTAGRSEASAQLEGVIQAFENATARLEEMTAVDSEALAASINEAILRLASERAGCVISEQPDSFADRIEALLAAIRAVSGQPSIRLNPADLASIQPLADTREKLRHCNFVADAALTNGDLSVMIGTIGIDDIIVPPKAHVKEISAEDLQDLVEDEAETDVELSGFNTNLEEMAKSEVKVMDADQHEDGSQDV